MRLVRHAAAALAILAQAFAGCASTRSAPPPRAEPRDRTDDPALVAARAAAEPEFETQADALAAGVYEEFTHPDSIALGGRAVVAPAAPGAAEVVYGEDPSTEALLGTLESPGPYNAETGAGVAPEKAPATSGAWTLQLGAFESETGALVRIRQIATDFPSLPRWYEREGDMVRVFVGRFADRGSAERERERLAAAGYRDVWVTPVP